MSQLSCLKETSLSVNGSNEPEMLQEFPPDQCEQFLKFNDGIDVIKTFDLV